MSTSVQDATVGRVLDGRYRVLSHIADGGMASVYLGLDERLDRRVAIKIMRAGLAQDDAFVSRFRREARAAARLSHPHVVQVHDQGEDDGDMFLVMEYAAGRTLREVIGQQGALPVREALRVFDAMLQALDAAHRAGLIHRDVKPENVLVGEDGTVKVADFGLVRAITSTTTTNQSGVLLGTVAYLSPEQVERGVADARSDVYAAGLVLFEMLTGEKAFAGETPIHVAYQHVHGAVPVASDRVSTVPQELDRLIALATARDPRARPATAGDLLVEVRRSRAELDPEQLDATPVLVAGLAGHEPSAGGAAATRSVPVAPGEAGSRPAGGEDAPAVPNGRSTPAATRELVVGVDGPASSGPSGADPDASSPAPDGSEAGDSPPRSRRRRVAWLLGALLLVVLAVGGWYLLLGPASTTLVPAVVGQPSAAAQTALTEADLQADVSEAYDEEVPKDQIMRSDPAAGAEIRKGTVVHLVVSRGPERYQPPSLVGQRRDDVDALLAAQHLSLGEVTEDYSEDVPAGVVLAQDPGPQASVKRDTPVAITVSKGRQPIEVPDLTGKPADDVTRTLAGLGLQSTQGQPVNSDTVPEGAVVSQDPAAGATRFRGDVVTVVLSKGPVLVQVPDTVGKQRNEAVQILKSAGFEVSVNEVLGAFFNTVRASNPAGGSLARKGSTITLTVV